VEFCSLCCDLKNGNNGNRVVLKQLRGKLLLNLDFWVGGVLVEEISHGTVTEKVAVSFHILSNSSFRVVQPFSVT
jgi:hypothetical protein